MGQLLVRNLDDEVIAKLKLLASQENASLEQTARRILSDSVRLTKAQALAELDRVRAMTKPSSVSSVDLLRAFRDGDDPDA